MAELWIVEENVNGNFLDDLDRPIQVGGKLDKAYFISAHGEEYAEHNKNFLLEFLLKENRYPLFMTFIVYEDQKDEYKNFLDENQIEYRLSFLEEKSTYYNFSGRHQYHPPCFTARITDSISLTLLLNELYWLPTQNEFFSISFSDNLRFELVEVIEWWNKRERSIPTFKIEQETVFITIAHDGAGFYLWSNKTEHFPVEKLIANLPEGTVVNQINDLLINDWPEY